MSKSTKKQRIKPTILKTHKRRTTFKNRSQYGGTFHITKTPEQGLSVNFSQLGQKSGFFFGGIDNDLQQIKAILDGSEYTPYEKTFIKHKLALKVYPDGLLTPTTNRNPPATNTLNKAIQKFVDQYCGFPEFEFLDYSRRTYYGGISYNPTVKYVNYKKEEIPTQIPDYTKYNKIADLEGCILAKDIFDDVVFGQLGLHLDDLVNKSLTRPQMRLDTYEPMYFCLLYDGKLKRYIICAAAVTITNDGKMNVQKIKQIFPSDGANQLIFYNIGKPGGERRNNYYTKAVPDYVFSVMGTAFRVNIIYGDQVNDKEYNYFLVKSRIDSDQEYFLRANHSGAQGRESPTHGRESPTRGRESPTRGRESPTRGRVSPTRGRVSHTRGVGRESPPPYTPHERSRTPPPPYMPRVIPSAPPLENNSSSEIDLT